MADEKQSAGEKAVAAVLPPSETVQLDPDAEEPKVIPKKGDDGYDTPSGLRAGEGGREQSRARAVTRRRSTA